MFLYLSVLAVFALMLTRTYSLPTDNAVLIHSYAKVANFGAASNSSSSPFTPSEARSNSGQTLWTHRSDANVITGQNLEKPVYYYSISKPSSKITESNDEIPAKGEIQERFNPPPYFDYEKPVPASKTKGKGQSDPKPSVVYGSPFDSFPVFKNSDTTPSNDGLYDSPFSSYNPPNKSTPDDDGTMYNFPPTQDNIDSKPPPDNFKQYLPPPPPAPSSPATSPPPQSNDDNYQFPFKPDDKPDDYQGPYAYKPRQPYDDEGPPITQTIAPPSFDHGPHYPTPPPDYHGYATPPPSMDVDHMPKSPAAPAPSMDDNAPPESMAEDDLSPPPEDVPAGGFGNIPQYLDHDPKEHGYNFYGYDHDHHHVYHEVTTTTTMAPEDTRVNKGQYSYYYLGRKLWYVPLYFSIYFIIYVTVLILKSISRHKVQFKLNHFDKYRKSRQLDVNDVHRNVNNGIENAAKMYM